MVHTYHDFPLVLLEIPRYAALIQCTSSFKYKATVILECDTTQWDIRFLAV